VIKFHLQNERAALQDDGPIVDAIREAGVSGNPVSVMLRQSTSGPTMKDVC
jgi:hypothetical protein